MTPDRLLDVVAVARRLGVHPETVRGWIRAGKIDTVTTPTGRYRIPASELARIMTARRIKQDSQNSQT